MDKALDHRALGRGIWDKALDHRALGRGVWDKALDHRALGHGLGIRHWTTEHWVMVWG